MKNMKKLGLAALAVAVAAGGLAGCDDESNAPAAAGGNALIDVSGGNGGLDGGTGGEGYELYVYKESGVGALEVTGSGSANAAFKVHAPTPYLGDNPAVIAASITPTLYVDCAAVVTTAAGTVYLVTDSGTLYISDGDAIACEGNEIATGLKVNTGVTLTLPINMISWTDWGYIYVDYDIENRGTITAVDYSATQRGSVDLEANSYIGSGMIKTSGTTSVPNAGSIYIWADYAMINSGKMEANGADSSTGDGGDAGYIDLESYYYTQNTASLTANGGSTTFAGGSGGSGDYIQLYTYYGATVNSGAMTGNGGSGDTGGDAADMYLYTGNMGNVFNTGNVSAEGGKASVNDGGSGGWMEVDAYGGEVRNSGTFDASGGDTTGDNGSGGNGGDLYVYTDYSSSFYEYSPMGPITWSGAVNLSGGNAVQTASGTGNGGDAGYFDVYHYSSGYPSTADVKLVGYSKIDASGGDGDFGGDGYGVYLYNYEGYDNYTGYNTPGGSVLAEVTIDVSGGDALAGGTSTNASTSEGGDVYLETDYTYYAGAPVTSTLKGNVIGHGGQGRNGTGSSHSTYLWLWGYDGATYSGTFDANGGKDIGADGGTDGYGGHADSLEIYAELGETNVSGVLKASGGYGEYYGGHTDDVYIWGRVTNVSASINVDGGDADPMLAGSMGNGGGWLEIRASSSMGSVTGSFSTEGGTGDTEGEDGGIWTQFACTGPSC